MTMWRSGDRLVESNPITVSDLLQMLISLPSGYANRLVVIQSLHGDPVFPLSRTVETNAMYIPDAHTVLLDDLTDTAEDAGYTEEDVYRYERDGDGLPCICLQIVD